MGRLDRLARRVPSPARAAAVIGLALASLDLPHLVGSCAAMLYEMACSRGLPNGPVASAMRDLIGDSATIVGIPLTPVALAVTFAVPLAMLARMAARARIRVGLPDPLDRVRQWTASHPRATRAVLAVPAAWWVGVVWLCALSLSHRWGGYFMFGHLAGTPAVVHAHDVYGAWMAGLACVLTAPSVLVDKGARAGLRAFLAPTVDIREKDEAAAPNSERRVAFNAVAVTAETRAAVALMAVLPVATLFAMNALKLGDTASTIALAAYASMAIGGALAFRRASRVAIGVDGIFITGTSRSRFFAYRDVDTVRANGSDIEVLRKTRVVLRLQLHGEDATQKETIIRRMQEAVDAAKQRKTAAVGEIVASASDETLARLVDGGEGYRSASVTKDQLWSLVRAPEPEAGVRTAAARALITTGGVDERARLRVAANECAQPKVRVALMEVADEDEEDEAAGPAARRMKSR